MPPVGGTSADGQQPRDFANRVIAVKAWLADPGATNTSAIDVVHYDYDSTGNLREVLVTHLARLRHPEEPSRATGVLPARRDRERR